MLYDGARAKARRVVITVVTGAIAGIFVLGALIWLDIALYFYCQQRFSAPIAALIAAGAFLVVAILALIPLTISGSRAPALKALGTPDPGVAAMQEVTNLMKRHQGAILIAAALAGVVLGTKRR